MAMHGEHLADAMRRGLQLCREVGRVGHHPDVIDLDNTKVWDALGEGKVLDVFQFSTGVGLATAKQVKPRNPTEMMSANALMRLMGEKDKEIMSFEAGYVRMVS